MLEAYRLGKENANKLDWGAENINSLDKLESASSTSYSIGNLSLYLLSIDVKENNYSFTLYLTSMLPPPKI